MRFLLPLSLLLSLTLPLWAQNPKLLPSQSATNSIIATNQWSPVTGSTTVYEVGIVNSSASDVWCFVYDSATNKLDNTAFEITPVLILAGKGGGYNWRSNGRQFYKGVTVATSTTDRTLTNGAAAFLITIEHTK